LAISALGEVSSEKARSKFGCPPACVVEGVAANDLMVVEASAVEAHARKIATEATATKSG
jgi:hypothetical protein